MMKTAWIAAAIFFGATAWAKTDKACAPYEKSLRTATAAGKLGSFLDVQWKRTMENSPEWATYAGEDGYNDRWSDFSMEGAARFDAEVRCQLETLKKIPRAALSEADRLNYDIDKYGLETAIEGQKFGEIYLVMDQMGGPQVWITDLLAAAPKRNVKDYEDMITRLERWPAHLEQIEARLREGLKRKVTPARTALQRVPAQFDALLTADPKDSPIYGAFKDIEIDLSADAKADLRARALNAIGKGAYPALRRLRAFLVEDYIPGAREKIAWAEMPDGRAWYEWRARRHTTTRLTADRLHELGLSEVARLRAEMEKIKESTGFKGDLKAFNDFLRTDERFFHKSAADLLTGYREIAKRIDPELPKLFGRLPRLTYGVREMPEYKAKDAPTAYYQCGTLKGARAGYFEANTYDLKARPKWGMEALTAHEAVPGHHLQISLAQETEDLPKFRRNDGFTAFVEGWGLYAEGLGEEIGLYRDPYSKYGQLSYEIWRAIRLVVDTGMHVKGWSRERALEYFQTLMPVTDLDARNEIDRYIADPGQALAYKVGQLKFRELRTRAKSALGDRFDVRAFHDEVLRHGAVPLDVLDRLFADWLAKRKPRR